jgi:hypothetical protein
MTRKTLLALCLLACTAFTAVPTLAADTAPADLGAALAAITGPAPLCPATAVAIPGLPGLAFEEPTPPPPSCTTPCRCCARFGLPGCCDSCEACMAER